MKVHTLMHVSYEGLGSMEPWLKNQGAEMSFTHLYQGQELPETTYFDLIVIMGGPMSVHDTEEFTWLVQEKSWIKKALEEGRKILGICLGAQLLAEALGAEVIPAPEREIGWFPIKKVKENQTALGNIFPEVLTVFHWHGETFSLPEGTQLLAASKACRNQAFTMGENILGLQFHLETTPELALNLIQHSHEAYGLKEFIQSRDEIKASPFHFQQINGLMEKIMNYFWVR
jgi:GMP synthase-like glutamine amidotransferase